MSARLMILATALACAAFGCEKSENEAHDRVISAWQKAGMMTTPLASLEEPQLAPGDCQRTTVDGLPVVLCRYADAASARAAQKAGLAYVGAATGLSLAAGGNLLILIDQEQKDPMGKKINAIASAFRDTLAPAAEAPAAGGAAASSDGDAGT